MIPAANSAIQINGGWEIGKLQWRSDFRERKRWVRKAFLRIPPASLPPTMLSWKIHPSIFPRRETTLFIARRSLLVRISLGGFRDFYGSRDGLRIPALVSLRPTFPDRVQKRCMHAWWWEKECENVETHRCRGCSGSPGLDPARTMACHLVGTLEREEGLC